MLLLCAQVAYTTRPIVFHRPSDHRIHPCHPNLAHMSVRRGLAFADNSVDACGPSHIDRVLSFQPYCLNQLLVLVFAQFWKRSMPMPKMVQKCAEGEDVCSFGEFVLSSTRVTRLCILLRHGFHFDAAIVSK
jgi:hypothetical protein